MISSLVSVHFSLFTPLEQFDNVAWLSNRVVERVEPYTLYLLETEFDARDRYRNPLAVSSAFASAFTSRLSRGPATVTFLFLAAAYLFRAYGKQDIRNDILGGFSHFFLLAAIHILTGAFFTVWFADFFFVTETLDTRKTAFSFAPQLDIAFYLDETRVSLLLAFFLLGAGEEEDDEDFLLSEEGDLEFVEDVVAPLFLTNLGKEFTENSALYLKACGVFAFVLRNNLRGRLPYSDTATSSLGLTFWVALAVFGSLVALRLQKHGIAYFFSLFRPAGTPFPLLFLLIPIEFVSYSFRLVSLAVRLFANRRAGHTLRKVLIGFSYVFLTLGDLYALAAFLPGLVVFVLVFLERGVACIQAYIFVTLRRIYLKDIYVAH